jgi:Domain of unknown function (DUF4351)
MQYQDDNFSKAYTTALYQTKGEVKTNIQVKNDENLEIDLMFVANPQNSAWADEDLGLFDRLMRVHPTICIEHYSGYLNADHIIRSATRMDLYGIEAQKEAKKLGHRFGKDQKPFTWMLATGCSENTLRSFGARPDLDLGPGIYRVIPGLRMGIVVIRSLPETPETLWLRGLGKDQILTKAFDKIRSLPRTKRERNDIVGVCIRHYKYLSEKISTGLSNEEAAFMKTMQEIDTIYQAEMNRASLEGEKRGQKRGEKKGRQEERIDLILRQLNRRIGNLSIPIQTQIKGLSLEPLGLLAEDLLDFSRVEDLVRWLDENRDKK